jgi:type II secretory pathway pseudopilin PulG
MALVLIIVFAILAGLLALALIGLLVWKKKRSPRKASLFSKST